MTYSNIKNKILLFFAFTFILIGSLFSSSPVSAMSTEIVQTRIDVTSTTKVGNTITVVTPNEYDFVNCTYSIIYYDTFKGETAKVSDLLQEQAINKISNYSFSFEVSDDVLGVVIYKIGYKRGANDIAEKFTQGDVTAGETDSVSKKTWISVTTDQLVSGNICNDSEALGEILDGTNCDSYYMFYFNLETEVDDIIDISFKYKIKTVKKDYVWSGSYEDIEEVRVSVNKNEMVPNYSTIEQFLEAEVAAECAGNKICYLTNKSTFNDKYEELKTKYTFPVIGKDNRGGDAYQWYIQPLEDLTLTWEESWGGSVYEKQYLQELAIVEMSFYANGEYYEDIKVLDEDTGEVVVEHDLSWIDQIKEFFKNLKDTLNRYGWIIGLILLALIVSIVIIFIKPIWWILKGIWYAIKYTLGLPIVILYRRSKRKKRIKRGDKDFRRRMEAYEKEKAAAKNKSKNKKEGKKK